MISPLSFFRSTVTGPLRFQFSVLKTIRLSLPVEMESAILAMLFRITKSAECLCI